MRFLESHVNFMQINWFRPHPPIILLDCGFATHESGMELVSVVWKGGSMQMMPIVSLQ